MSLVWKQVDDLNGETEQSDDLIEIFLLAAATAWLFDCLFVIMFHFCLLALHLHDNSHAVNILFIKSHCRSIFNFVSSYFSIKLSLTLN